MHIKKLILVRHADYANGEDPGLTWVGKDQSVYLGSNIAKEIEGLKGVVIWTSTAKRASQTANLIKQQLPFSSLFEYEKLWSDNWHKHDFGWLKEQIEKIECDALIIVSHLEYVREFPHIGLGFGYNYSGYAEGVVITDLKTIEKINYRKN